MKNIKLKPISDNKDNKEQKYIAEYKQYLRDCEITLFCIKVYNYIICERYTKNVKKKLENMTLYNGECGKQYKKLDERIAQLTTYMEQLYKDIMLCANSMIDESNKNDFSKLYNEIVRVIDDEMRPTLYSNGIGNGGEGFKKMFWYFQGILFKDIDTFEAMFYEKYDEQISCEEYKKSSLFDRDKLKKVFSTEDLFINKKTKTQQIASKELEEMKSKFEEVDKKLQEKEEENNKLNSALKEANNKIGNLKAKVNYLQSDLQLQNTDNSQLNKKVKEAKQQINELQKYKNVVEGMEIVKQHYINEAKDMNDLFDKMTELTMLTKEQLQQYRASNDNLRAKEVEQEAIIKKLREELAKTDELNKKLKVQDKDIQNLQALLSSKEKNINKLENDLEKEKQVVFRKIEKENLNKINQMSNNNKLNKLKLKNNELLNEINKLKQEQEEMKEKNSVGLNNNRQFKQYGWMKNYNGRHLGKIRNTNFDSNIAYNVSNIGGYGALRKGNNNQQTNRYNGRLIFPKLKFVDK